MKTILKLTDISFRYGNVPVLEGVSLSISDTGFLAIIGPNGGGKTSILKLILGLIEPVMGELVYLDGLSCSDIGYVPQVSGADRTFPINVMDTVLQGLTGTRLGIMPYTKEDKQRAVESLEKVRMLDHAQLQVGELSEGQRQRVFMARALISNPRLLLLDEPTASVDPSVQEGVYQLLNDLKSSTSIILVTHDIGAISEYVDEVACLNRKLHYHGDTKVGEDVMEKTFGCHVDLIAHGHPHRVLKHHH